MDNTLLIPFIGENDDPIFVRGFECGQVWELLSNGKIADKIFHSDNIDQMHLICEYYKCDYRINPIDETWSELIIT